MHHKRLISLMLTLALALSLTACGSSTTTPSVEPEVNNITESQSETAESREYTVRITELMAKNRATLRDADGDYSDWIELVNYGSESVSLSGLYLSDKSGSMGWQLPERELAPGEYLLVFASGKDRAEDEPHTDFSLSEGETLYLRNSGGEELSTLQCITGNADTSVVTGENGAETCIYPTPGRENSIESYISMQAGAVCEGPLAVNEVCTFNTKLYYAGVNTIENDDWVEIRNISSEPVKLAEYYLSDDLNELTILQLPDEILLPGAVKVMLLNEGSFGLDSECDRIYISDMNGKIIDAVPLLSIPADCSYGRMEGENGFFYFAKPTPDRHNADGRRYIAEAPVCLTKDGVFDGVDSITVELSGKGRIYYTTDGTLPTEESMLYTAPFTVESTTAVRAICAEDGAINSHPISANFILNENHTLPVVALNFDDWQQYSYVWHEELKTDEIPCSLSFYEDGGSFSINAGMKLNGETSLILPKKNMSLRFRGCYGEPTLKYDIYGGGVAEFQNLLLRAGQDYYSAVVRNELCQELCLDFSDNVITQRSRFVVLYINGEYFGLYTIKEKTNEALYAFMTGTDIDNAEALEANIWENTDLYRTVLGYAQEHDMSRPECYEEIAQHLDIDSLIDWLIAEGMSANHDLTSGNLRYVRSTETDGRWRLMYYDLDATFAEPELIFRNVLAADRSYQQITELSRRLMKNTAFRARFLIRAAEAISTVYTNENILAKLDELAAEIEVEIQRDYDFRYRPIKSWYNNLEYVRNLITENDWAGTAVKHLAELFKLTAEEKEHYFGK